MDAMTYKDCVKLLKKPDEWRTLALGDKLIGMKHSSGIHFYFGLSSSGFFGKGPVSPRIDASFWEFCYHIILLREYVFINKWRSFMRRTRPTMKLLEWKFVYNCDGRMFNVY